jgi:hypothetical protein
MRDEYQPNTSDTSAMNKKKKALQAALLAMSMAYAGATQAEKANPMDLANKDSQPEPFLSLFDIGKKNDDGSYVLVSKQDMPGGRLILIPRIYGTACMLAVDPTPFSFDFYRRAFNEAFLKFPGAMREGPPSLTWVYEDSASQNTALMSDQVEPKEGMLVVAIEREE